MAANKINWKIGHTVKFFDGAYSTGTIVRVHDDGRVDVARPYLHAAETGGWHIGVEMIYRISYERLIPAEVNPRTGEPRRFYQGCLTWDDLTAAEERARNEVKP